jgi:hypothetical protein
MGGEKRICAHLRRVEDGEMEDGEERKKRDDEGEE